MAITVQVPWQTPYNNDRAWNELLAWTMEQFGLPNTDRYHWRASEGYMEFVFRDEHDALMFQLYCGYSERMVAEI